MPYIKLTNPRFANLTGQLPGKNFRGISFVNGISALNLPLATADKIAAQLAGTRLVTQGGVDQGPAGSLYRKTTTVPTPAVPRTESVYPANGDAALAELRAEIEALKG